MRPTIEEMLRAVLSWPKYISGENFSRTLRSEFSTNLIIRRILHTCKLSARIEITKGI